MKNEVELVKKAEEISKGLKRLSKKSRKVVLPYHSSYAVSYTHLTLPTKPQV